MPHRFPPPLGRGSAPSSSLLRCHALSIALHCLPFLPLERLELFSHERGTPFSPSTAFLPLRAHTALLRAERWMNFLYSSFHLGTGAGAAAFAPTGKGKAALLLPPSRRAPDRMGTVGSVCWQLTAFLTYRAARTRTWEANLLLVEE